MEKLKPRDQLTTPDERNQNFVVSDEQGTGFRQLTLDDLYAEAISISLLPSVPENVQSHFSGALNLLVYSWFHYPFRSTAESVAFASVEMSLKERFEHPKQRGLRQLLQRAVNDGLISDEGFADVVPIETDRTEPYCSTLIRVMPNLRNEHAHGTTMLHPNVAVSLRICATLINQLYSER